MLTSAGTFKVKQKAISPMVAVVLLIAFTIGVGGLVSIFATSLTTTSTGIASNQSEALTRCAGAWIDVHSVTSTQVYYSNPNSQTLTTIILVPGNSVNTVTGATTLAPGASTVTSWTAGTNTSVIARGLCQTLVTVEGRCTSAHECWDV